MSDQVPDTNPDRGKNATPGSSAGDAAHTTKIPRISDGESSADGETDKGRRRPPPAKKASEPSKNTASKSPASKTSSSKTSASKTSASKSPASKSSTSKNSTTSGGNASGRPLSAGDYARTTSQSPSTTAVIPAVKAERQASSMPQTVAPSNNRQQSQKSAQPSDSTGEARGREATLRMSYVEPWSVTRMAFAISVAMMIVSVVAVTIFWVVLDTTGVWTQVDDMVTSVLSDDSSSFRITDYLGFGRLVGLSLVVSALNVVIMTVLATIAAHLYNLAAQLMGGFEVTYTSQD